MDVPFMIVGDPAYPLLPWLIKGYTGFGLSAEEESFNVHLSSARITVEQGFGRLKARWRILQKQMDCNYEFSAEVIAACCTLHNFVENNKERFSSRWLEEAIQSELLFPQPEVVRCADRESLQGTVLRTHIKNYLAENFPLRKTIMRA